MTRVEAEEDRKRKGHWWHTIKVGHTGEGGSFKNERCVKCGALWCGEPSQYPDFDSLPVCLPWSKPWDP